MYAKANGTAGSMDLHFSGDRAQYEADTSDLVIRNGNVGIGTDIPGGKLQIDGDDGTKSVRQLLRLQMQQESLEMKYRTRRITTLHQIGRKTSYNFCWSDKNSSFRFADGKWRCSQQFSNGWNTFLKTICPADWNSTLILEEKIQERNRIGKNGHTTSLVITLKPVTALQVTGTLNATSDVKINGTSAATTGKAIAMAMLFG